MKTRIALAGVSLAVCIWSLTPALHAQKQVPEQQVNVASLEQQGVSPLDDAALKALVVGKTLVVRNRLTGRLYEATYYEGGQRLLRGLQQQQIASSVAYGYHGGMTPEGIAPYRIENGRLVTTLDGEAFAVAVYKVNGKYLGAAGADGGGVNWELAEGPRELAAPKVITEASLKKRGVSPLDETALRELIVGKTVVVRNRITGEKYEAMYSADGKREVRNVTPVRARELAWQAYHGGAVRSTSAPYRIQDGQIVTTFDGHSFEARIYKLNGKYIGASSVDHGVANWELLEVR
ncbi:MAG: hypothetical protein JSW10_09400 [Pseudomonadota bacterium]|nr:MAG: hypothetical protein JSW10_09400 [Pseudomonadota bacterium]